MTSGIAFDRPDRLSHLRVFPYDRFKVVSVVRLVCDRLGSVSIISSRSSEHFLRRLGRSGRSGRSYGNQALMQWGAPYEDWRRIQARSKHKMTGGAERVAHINSPPPPSRFGPSVKAYFLVHVVRSLHLSTIPFVLVSNFPFVLTLMAPNHFHFWVVLWFGLFLQLHQAQCH